jgi:hypothetical protein
MLAFRKGVYLLWLTILRESYKVTLAGLYFAALTTVNLFNSGYSTSKPLHPPVSFSATARIGGNCFVRRSVVYVARLTFPSVLFFIIFALSASLAKNAWFLIVLYCEIVICIIYIWQVSWTIPVEQEHQSLFTTIGLKHCNVSHTPFPFLCICDLGVVELPLPHISCFQVVPLLIPVLG